LIYRLVIVYKNLRKSRENSGYLRNCDYCIFDLYV
jgi:hypothetical protein